MATITIPRKELQKYGLPDCGYDGVKLIQDEIIDHRRWSVNHSIVFRWTDGKHYRTGYSVGATEYQDESPWEYEEEVECDEVIKVTRLVDDWVDADLQTSGIDYTALIEAARDFVAKVERGEARSVRSYAAFKAALGEAVN